MVPKPLKFDAMIPETKVPCEGAPLAVGGPAGVLRPTTTSVDSDEMRPWRSAWAKSMPESTTAMLIPAPVAPAFQAVMAPEFADP
ncbi:hypothetical protein GCM10009116_03980 [Brevundimonas basaltis]